MVKSLFSRFSNLFPHKFCNKTNGITPRRWLSLANKPLAQVLDSYIGTDWRINLSLISGIKPYLDDQTRIHQLQEAKFSNKQHLAQ